MNFPYHAIRRQNWYRSLISTFMIVPLAWSGFFIPPQRRNLYVSPTGSIPILALNFLHGKASESRKARSQQAILPLS